jgi:hypothetical protein
MNRMPKLAMVLEPSDPKMSPRQMVRRDQFLVMGAIVLLVAVVVGGFELSGFRRERHRFRTAQARLQAIPGFADTHLSSPGSRLGLEEAADLVREDGTVLGTVSVQGNGDLYLGLQTPGLNYKPLTASALKPYLASGELLDADATRFASNAAGALLMLWPGLGKESIHYDKVEAVTLTAPKATVDVGLRLENDERIGVALELDLVRGRLLSLDLRKR